MASFLVNQSARYVYSCLELAILVINEYQPAWLELRSMGFLNLLLKDAMAAELAAQAWFDS